ncbi:Cyclic nucleotide-gated ion channel 1 [Citrus sinensis]|uniref:Cyclic nucleotide-gated ion channel 1 n=1 Tax=Citrus sinensis TaxID=2711 RepID=A0ACB8MPJ1_CITSI|nr:Cyclic nucleotide-gated ion channel 1 [Citrus sinensis]KAH9732297.1 Cyclic nucleotide-gated ion channel 1 [Citrus sinensis]KAH9787511.1 cyclic nucleotide-gated ion channel 1 [Citrus sinensis]
MNTERVKFVRFDDWNSENSYSEQKPSNDDGFYPRVMRPTLSAVMDSIRRGYEMGSERIKSWKKPLSFRSHVMQSEKKSVSEKRILDPQVIDGKRKCLGLDKTLEITACVLRSFIDTFYILRIIFQFRTGFIARSSRVFGRGELVDDPKAIAKRYLMSYFIVDILAILPLPQLVVLIIVPAVKGPVPLVAKEMLKTIIFCQYVPRIARIYPLYNDVKRTSGILTETAWAGAALNLFLYMLASHIFGACWYLYSIERQDSCWRDVCRKLNDTNEIKNSSMFNFGISIDALQSRVVEEHDFPKKFFYCFWWGLRNLSSLGQNLKTSTFVGEVFFAIFISISGLVLFALLIGNMQKYLESTTVRLEEMRVKRQDAEQWMSHRMLPENLRDRIRRYEQYKWQETRGVEEEGLLRNLPKDLRRDIKRHLCWDLLMRVPMFEKMDDQLLDAMCDHLKPVLYTEKSFIVREGDPVEEMLFVMRGNLVSTTTYGGRTGFFNAVYLKAGDFCGEALLTWALDPQSSSNRPLSTRTVQALTEVEAFSLMADDLKSVASQFRRLHSKQLQHAFRQWRTWAACFIQAAWRRHSKKKLAQSLQEAEDRLQDALATEAGALTSLGATMYASKFAANLLHPLRLRQNGSSGTRLPQRLLPPLIPQKPAEPDFTAKD